MPVRAGEHQRDDVEIGVRRFHRQVTSDYQSLSAGNAATIVQRRETAEKVRERWTQGGPQMAETLDLRVGRLDVPIRIHRPASDPSLPVMIYVHGGGWTLFSLDTHDRLMREYAARAGITVVGIDYSLAPEARFPSQIDEIRSLVQWLRSPEARSSLAPGKIAIGGDSAGGNLALATCLALRDSGEAVLDAILINYGALDPQQRSSHDRYGGEEYMLTPEEMAEFWANYLPEQFGMDPLARPLLADLHGLPPTYICIAECDILADENWELKRRLEASGIHVVAKSFPGATHSFLEAVSVSDLAGEALNDASDWLAKVLKP
jgi:acetyl esterase